MNVVQQKAKKKKKKKCSDGNSSIFTPKWQTKTVKLISVHQYSKMKNNNNNTSMLPLA